MARSDKVPFRREFTVSTNGYLGSADGFFVGDILSLHIAVLGDDVGILLQGKVGRTGEWQNISVLPSTDDKRHYNDIDIRAFEYFRLELFNVKASTDITLFGYENNIDKQINIVQLSDRDRDTVLSDSCTLKEIKEELLKLNQYMHIITGDKL
jgi:hypothetical protein